MSQISLNCPNCSKDFFVESWYKNRQDRKGSRIFCSRKCSTIFSNKSRYPKRLLRCEGCNKEEYVRFTDDRKKYCSKKCYFDHQRPRLIKRARQLGKDSSQKISETKKKMYAENPECHGRLDKTHSEETKKLQSNKRKEYFIHNDGYWKGKSHSIESRERMSETRTKKWVEGGYDHLKSCWAKGRYLFKKANKEVWYRSSWELAYMKYLDAREDIIGCEYESVKVLYIATDNQKKNYIPDFLIFYKNGKSALHEIKPFVRKDSETNKRKFKAARQYCKENNIDGFKVITEKYLRHIGAVQ